MHEERRSSFNAMSDAALHVLEKLFTADEGVGQKALLAAMKLAEPIGGVAGRRLAHHAQRLLVLRHYWKRSLRKT